MITFNRTTIFRDRDYGFDNSSRDYFIMDSNDYLSVENDFEDEMGWVDFFWRIDGLENLAGYNHVSDIVLSVFVMIAARESRSLVSYSGTE